MLLTFTVAVGISLGASLAQWSNSDIGPSKIQWFIILVAAATQGGKDLLSFLSSAWSDYKAAHLTGGNGNTPPATNGGSPLTQPTAGSKPTP